MFLLDVDIKVAHRYIIEDLHHALLHLVVLGEGVVDGVVARALLYVEADDALGEGLVLLHHLFQPRVQLLERLHAGALLLIEHMLVEVDGAVLAAGEGGEGIVEKLLVLGRCGQGGLLSVRYESLNPIYYRSEL